MGVVYTMSFISINYKEHIENGDKSQNKDCAV